MRCAYYCCGDSFDLPKIAEFFEKQDCVTKIYEPEVLHVRENTDEGEDARDLFIFSYGCITFWGVNEDDEHAVQALLEPFVSGKMEKYIVDSCQFDYDPMKETSIDEESDLILLESDDPLIKLSLSYGLSQSVKLSAFELSVDNTIETTKHIPQQLIRKGKISMSKRSLSRKMGELFAEKNAVNLHSTILDLPEFFWRRPKYTPYYYTAVEYLDIKTRLDILNQRLAVISELYDMMNNQLQHRHSSFLEWIIIYLILFEIMVTIFHDLLKLI